ncbi:MAG: hypothetical protein AVDCRST_MAG56-1352 [uncultured Cytophagales bacterium]|uniref:Uncharacterized protein n=1 Tax=uncultured Cytophagales bacterium TaxID=158755 RepID=A0A6J4HWH8_9SPHI|nr:MAG: hypothetical protein AVDCRST_MAG56-1352 [uncultured Cytophagales bacterium]
MVAMVITMTVFGIGTMTYLNVMRAAFSGRQARAVLLLNEAAIRARDDRKFFNEVTEAGDLRIVRKADLYHGLAGLYLLAYVVEDSTGRQLAAKRILVNADE